MDYEQSYGPHWRVAEGGGGLVSATAAPFRLSAGSESLFTVVGNHQTPVTSSRLFRATTYISHGVGCLASIF